MKRLFAFVLVLLAGLAFAEVPQLDLYLLIGQSNMAGRGKLTDENRLSTDGVWKLDKHDQWVAATEPLHFDKPNVAGAGLGMSFAPNSAFPRTFRFSRASSDRISKTAIKGPRISLSTSSSSPARRRCRTSTASRRKGLRRIATSSTSTPSRCESSEDVTRRCL